MSFDQTSNLFDATLQKINVKFRKTMELNRALEAVQTELYKQFLKPIVTVETRFFSQFLMLERTSNLRISLNACV